MAGDISHDKWKMAADRFYRRLPRDHFSTHCSNLAHKSWETMTHVSRETIIQQTRKNKQMAGFKYRKNKRTVYHIDAGKFNYKRCRECHQSSARCYPEGSSSIKKYFCTYTRH